MKTHNISYRIYYEDTDAGGVVYYANYLKFAERARAEFLRANKIIQSKLAQEENCLFVVRHIEADFKKPAKLDDLINISSSIKTMKKASLIMQQIISKDETQLCTMQVKIACIDKQLKPRKMPDKLIALAIT